MYHYILFDLDGTISDPAEGITRSVQYALHSMGIEVEDRRRLEPFIGPPLLDSFMEFYGMDRQQAECAIAKYRERFSEKGLYENELYPGMEKMLATLRKAGCHLAVASSKPEGFVERILDYFHIAEYFEVVVGSCLNGERTGKEEVVREALFRLFGGEEIPAGDVVMVGDRKFDVTGAGAVGLPCVAVAYGYAQPGEWEECRPEKLAESVEQLGEMLLA